MDNLNQTEADASNTSEPSKDKSSDGISFSQNGQNVQNMQSSQNGQCSQNVQNCRNVQNGQTSQNGALDNQNVVSIDKISTDVATAKQPKGEHPDKKKKPKKKRNIWWIKAIVISLVLSAFFSYISNLVENADQLVVVIVLLAFLVLTGILFDAIGVAVTSCDVTPIISMASRKVYGAKTALNLVKNSDTVSSVCNDIIGDIFSIISGACAAALVVKITVSLQETWQIVVSIAVSALVSAMTIGGKAFMKKIAIENSKDFVMFVARILAIFSKEERKIRKKNKADKAEKTGKADKSNGKSDKNEKFEKLNKNDSKTATQSTKSKEMKTK